MHAIRSHVLALVSATLLAAVLVVLATPTTARAQGATDVPTGSRLALTPAPSSEPTVTTVSSGYFPTPAWAWHPALPLWYIIDSRIATKRQAPAAVTPSQPALAPRRSVR